MLGINPGRFGAGVTGITFTDPVRLEKECGIPNNFDKRQELSSVFIYDFIAAWGGAEAFYSRFFLSAVFPLGFTREGRNLNYYDDPQLMGRLRDRLRNSRPAMVNIIMPRPPRSRYHSARCW